MRVGIYNQPAEGGIGGSEISVAVLAEALACDNRVDIVHHKPYMTRERLAELSGADLSEVRMRPVVEESVRAGEPQVRLVHEGRRMESVAVRPGRQLGASEVAELAVDGPIQFGHRQLLAHVNGA